MRHACSPAIALFVLLTGIAAVTLPATAAADRMETTRGEEVREVAHTVGVVVEDGTATYTVRRAFHNYGDRADQVFLQIRLPYGAAATGLRIRASKKWHEAELMEADKARKKYRELTGVGPHEPKDPALLEWAWADRLNLHIFPVFPGRTSIVEYELTAPTRYDDGTYLLTYPTPNDAKKFATPTLLVQPDAPGATISVAGRNTSAGRPVSIAPQSARNHCASFARSGASCVTSELQVDAPVVAPTDGEASEDQPEPDKKEGTQVRATLDIRHTYRGDLEIFLTSPGGRMWGLSRGEGGDENDVRNTFTRTFPPEAKLDGTWRLEVADELALDKGTVESWSLAFGPEANEKTYAADGMPLFIPDANNAAAGAGLFRIEVGTDIERKVRGRLGRVEASTDTAFSRLEVDVAEQLSDLPERASYVFVVDASHSVPDGALQAQIDILRAMLHHVPDARFEIIAARRNPTRIVDGFARAASVDEVLAEAKKNGAFERGNGSHLNRALSRATRLLDGRRAPKYLVTFSDALLREAWTPEGAVDELRALDAQTTAHVVIPHADYEPLSSERDDEHRMAPLAAEHGGILTHFHGVPSDKTSKLRQLALGLVRPVRIANLAIDGLELSEPPTELAEGESLREMLQLKEAPGSVALSGELWSTPWTKKLTVDTDFSRATAGFVFSKTMHTGLSKEEMLRVARFGRAVSPVTSYLAVEPGVRPSTIGLEDHPSVVPSLAGRGSGGGGRGYGGTHIQLPDLLKKVVDRCLRSHGDPSGWQATLDVETTRDEIVAVELAPRPKQNKAVHQCIVEKTWATRVPSHYEMRRRDRVKLQIPGTK